MASYVLICGQQINKMLTLEQKINLSKNIIEKAVSDYQNIFFSFSGGKDSAVMLDLVYKIKPNIKIVGIDTGYEFEETIEFTDRLMKKYGTEIEYLRPTEEQHEEILKHYRSTAPGEIGGLLDGKVSSFVKDGQWYCCAHKEPALRNFLERGEYNAWLTGLRADETENRKLVGIYQKGKNGIQKINSIIFWESPDIWEYIKLNNLGYHPKYDQGYKSLGCKPCTEAGLREGKGMQSRFEEVGLSGERVNNSECGLHL